MLEKFSANDFPLSEAEYSFSGPLNRRGIIDLPLPKFARIKCFLGSNMHFCFIAFKQVWQL